MDLGSVVITGERDGTGAAAAYAIPDPTNLARENIAAFDDAQIKQAAKLRKAMCDAACEYLEYVNQPAEKVREESKNIKPGVNTMVVDPDAKKKAAPAAAKKAS